MTDYNDTAIKMMDQINCFGRNESMRFKDASTMTLFGSQTFEEIQEMDEDNEQGNSLENLLLVQKQNKFTKQQILPQKNVQKIQEYVIQLREKIGDLSLKEVREKAIEKKQIRKYDKFMAQMQFLGFHPKNKGSILHEKTDQCQHRHGCLTNTLMSLKNTFKYSLIFKLVVHYLIRLTKILKIRSFKQFYKIFLSWEDNKDNLRFAFVFAMMNATYRAILCGFRTYCKQNGYDLKTSDQLVAPLAGFIAGLWLILENKWRRTLLCVLLVSKAYDPIVNLISEQKCIKSVLSKQPMNKDHLLFLMWTLATVVGQYTVCVEPPLMSKSQYNTYLRFCKKSYNDHMMCAQFYRQHGHLSNALSFEKKYVRL